MRAFENGSTSQFNFPVVETPCLELTSAVDFCCDLRDLWCEHNNLLRKASNVRHQLVLFGHKRNGEETSSSTWVYLNGKFSGNVVCHIHDTD